MYRVLKPRYWQLVILCVIGIVLLGFVQVWNVSDTMRTSADFGIVWCGYGVFNLWLAVNGGAVEREQETEQDAAEGKDPAINVRQSRYRRALRHRLQHDE
jgi:hypothetical protein